MGIYATAADLLSIYGQGYGHFETEGEEAGVIIDLNDLQTFIVTRLIDAEVADGRVYDEPPQAKVFPFVEIAGSVNETDNTSDADGVQHTLTINIWSEHRGFKEVNQIARQVTDSLDLLQTSIDGMNVILFVESYTSLDGADGVTRQGVVRVRCAARI